MKPVCATLVLGAVLLTPVAAVAATVNVTVSNFQFMPAQVVISQGDTVVWTWSNTNGINHSVTSGLCP